MTDGDLEAILVLISEHRKAPLEDLRMQARDALLEGAASGKLLEAGARILALMAWGCRDENKIDVT